MNKETIKSKIITPRLDNKEELIGFFLATCEPSSWWYILLGPLSIFGMRRYYVAVTDQGVHLHRMSFFGKPDTYNYFPYADISDIKLRKGFVGAPLQFTFANGRKLKLKAQLKGMAKIPKLDDEIYTYLLSKKTTL